MRGFNLVLRTEEGVLHRGTRKRPRGACRAPSNAHLTTAIHPNPVEAATGTTPASHPTSQTN